MATDTEQTHTPEQLTQMARDAGISPADIPGGLTQLPEWIKLAETLGKDLKDLFENKNSSVITIVNRTKLTLYFQEELTGGDHARHGEFATPPPDQIAPGDTGTFLSAEAPKGILTGDEAWIVYAVGDADTCKWTLHWDNPESTGISGSNSADQKIEFPNGQTRPDGSQMAFQGAVEFAQNGSTAIPFQFVIREEGFGGGGDGVLDKNTCVITVINHTSQTLFLNETHSDDGDFVSFPDDEIAPGAQTVFNVSEKTRPDHEREGVTGYARYTVTQDASKCMWTVFWSNPESGANIANDRLDGSDTAHYQTGPAEMPTDTKENAPVRFILRDAGGGAQPPIHPVDPPVNPVDPNEQPPPQAGEPTLRLHDDSVDGWVEYLQQLLNAWGNHLGVDGNFGPGTQQAVLAFQGQKGLMVDGVVGNQTWAALREENPEPPSTDGRAPHTYVEEGPEARWVTEDHAVFYEPMQDMLVLGAYNTGNVPIASDQFVAIATLTSVADGRQVQLHLPSYATGGQAEPGVEFSFVMANMSHEAGPGEWTVLAWMPAELGGDEANGHITVGGH